MGAGLAGLVVASILHKHGISVSRTRSPLEEKSAHSFPKFTIYERDASATAREHLGGTLDLHHESGQRALVECGLEAELKANSRPEGEETYVVTYRGEVLWHDVGGDGRGPPSRPEMDRTVLRRILL